LARGGHGEDKFPQGRTGRTNLIRGGRPPQGRTLVHHGSNTWIFFIFKTRAFMIKNIPDIICSVCGKVFKFESGMRAHMESHLKGKIKCFECGKQYASDWILGLARNQI
jgi:hypothetical protein